jgi:PleD family two-component response regulator
MNDIPPHPGVQVFRFSADNPGRENLKRNTAAQIMTSATQNTDQVHDASASRAREVAVARADSSEVGHSGNETDRVLNHAAGVPLEQPVSETNLPGVECAKIMIVDDAPMTLRLMQAFLEDAGYKDFVTTSRSAEAMSLLLAERPDVLLLDLNMPEVSGFDILAQVRSHAEVQHVPVLILTASDDAASKLQALELGA